MKTIKVHELTPEQVFESNLMLSHDCLFVGKGIPIVQSDIERLRKWQIEEIFVEDEVEVDPNAVIDDFEQLVVDMATFSSIYENCLKRLTEELNTFLNNNRMDLTEVKGIVSEIIDLAKKNGNILLNAVSQKEVTDDNRFYVQSLDVCAISVIIGIAVNLSDERLPDLGLGAILYDIGMLRLSRSLLKKKGNFTPEERKQMTMHTLLGYKTLKQLLRLSDNISLVAAEHHERMDGSGYPRRLPGEKIHPYAKIVAIAQAFEGITKKPVQEDGKKITLYQGMQIILKEGSSKFDGKIVKAFLSAMSLYPIGSLVILNNGFKAVVLGSNPAVPMRPVIKIMFDNNDEYVKNGDMINLSSEPTLFIKGCETDASLIDKAMEEMFKDKGE